MLEVVPGLLLGSEGDALAVLSRVPSVTKHYTVTHILTIANEPLDWSDFDQSETENGKERDSLTGVQCEGSDHVTGEGGDPVPDEDGDPVTGEGGDPVKVVGSKQRFVTKFIRLADMPESDLLHHFESCCRFIKEAIQTGTVLVHCVHGISRSVSVVLAYLMWSEGRSFQVTYDSLKERKPEIRPNRGFIEQLKLWGAMRCRLDNSNKLYKAYRLKTVAREMKDSGYLETLEMSPDPLANAIESSAYYRCRKCRRLLFTDDSVLPHDVGKGAAAFKWHKRTKPGSSYADTKIERHSNTSPEQEDSNAIASEADIPEVIDSPDEVPNDQGLPLSPAHVTPVELAKIRAQVATVTSLSGSSSDPRCSSYFVEPVEWMESSMLGMVEGKVLCPKCSSRLGSFNWSGDQCSCGQWVTPAFQIHKSRVDETRTLTKRKIHKSRVDETRTLTKRKVATNTV